jgi:hypothetical protein
MRTFVKDPNEVLDYTVSWTGRLESGETISESTWVVDTGITQDSGSADTTAATIWLSGGTAGALYSIVNRITTSSARVYEQAFRINCVDSKNRT